VAAKSDWQLVISNEQEILILIAFLLYIIVKISFVEVNLVFTLENYKFYNIDSMISLRF
jgi:hypothetical protein